MWTQTEGTLLFFMVIGWAFSWLRARARYDGLKNVLADHKQALGRMERRLDAYSTALQRQERDIERFEDQFDEIRNGVIGPMGPVGPPRPMGPPATSPQKRQQVVEESSKDFWERLEG